MKIQLSTIMLTGLVWASAIACDLGDDVPFPQQQDGVTPIEESGTECELPETDGETDNFTEEPEGQGCESGDDHSDDCRSHS